MLRQLDVKSVVLPPLVVILLFGVIGLYSVSTENRWLLFSIELGALSFFGWCGVIPVICGVVKSQWKIGCEEIEAIKSTFLTQEIVDEKLRHLAFVFNDASKMEIRLQGVTAAEVELELAKDVIRRAKSAFWEANDLAKRQGYDVSSNLGGYLRLPIVHNTEAS